MKFSVAEITVAMKKAKINEYSKWPNKFKINLFDATFAVSVEIYNAKKEINLNTPFFEL